MARIALILVTLTFTLFAKAQSVTDRCGENYVISTFENMYGKGSYERLTTIEEPTPFSNSSNTEGTVYTIPVVVHVMYDDDESNITREQILDALRVINTDYRRKNADTVNTRNIFKSVAADAEIEFVLAKKDPSGNCTDGITRTYTTLTNGANNNVKPLVNWPNNRYMNIWVVKSIDVGSSQTVLGYAYLPVWGGNNYQLDGVVIRHDQMGTIGTATNIGRTLTHETGHYLGLNHPFNTGCSQNGDGLTDTPPAASANYGCDTTRNSCPNDPRPDQIENYMDYADDVCTNMFTQQQVNRMRNRISTPNYRGNLISSSNHNTVGITPGQVLPCKPEADFYIDNTLICQGSTIQFHDATHKGNPTSYTWSFPGGTPTSSTSANPTVTYNQPGSYAVSLMTTNANGNSTQTKQHYVSVRSQAYTPFVRSMVEDFESIGLPNGNWHVNSGLDTVNFMVTSNASYSGTQSATLQNFYAMQFSDPQANGMIDELISNSVDLKYTTDATLSFKYAFAEVMHGNNDRLRIHISDDCGATWTQVSQRLGPLLKTTNVRYTTPWQPTSMNEWKESTVDLTSYVDHPTFIMVKFEFENGGGNNFYIDDIMITTTIGEDEFETPMLLNVYPNPANDVLHISGTDDGAQIALVDLSGRMVMAVKSTNETTLLNVSALAQGVYILQVIQGDQMISEKVIIQ